MQIRIIKGTNQIGGCITEITSDRSTKIIIDYGYDLTTDESKPLYPIEGLTFGRKAYDAVFITHAHEDHIGLVSNVLEEIPVYVERTNKKIYEVISAFTSNTPLERELTTFDFESVITVNDDLQVIPYRTDHSAYKSAMFLVIDGEKKVLHMGDYRATGYSSIHFKENIKKIGSVDLLITEGTGITRGSTPNMSELSLKEEAIKIMKKYRQVFVLQSSSNVDRLRSFYEAAKETGKKVVFDISSANILKALDEPELDYLRDLNSSVWVANSYLDEHSKFLEKKGKVFYETYVEPFKKLTTDYNPKVHDEYVMFIKQSMIKDIEHNLKRYRDKAILIYSMWPGYIDSARPNTKKAIEFIDKVKAMGIDYHYLHTSGHADRDALRFVDNNLKRKLTIGIHTDDNAKLKTIFKNYKRIVDGDEINIGKKGVKIVKENVSLRGIDVEYFEKNLHQIRKWTERINQKENKDIFLGIRDDRLTFYYMGRELFTIHIQREKISIETRSLFGGHSAKAQALNSKFISIISHIPLVRNYGKERSELDATCGKKGNKFTIEFDNSYSVYEVCNYLIKNFKELLNEKYDQKIGDLATLELPVQNLYLNKFGSGTDDLFIVEMEFILPKEFKKRLVDKDIEGRYDMVALYKNHLVFIELKVNKEACLDNPNNDSSGIQSHIEDMTRFLEEYNRDGLLKKEFSETVKNMITTRRKLKLLKFDIDVDAIDFDRPDFWILLDMKDGTKIDFIEDIEKFTGSIEDKPFLKFYRGDIVNKSYEKLARKKD